MNLYFASAFISGTITGVLGFSAAWTIQGRNIDSLKLEQRDAIIQQQRSARAAIDRATNAVITAQNAAAARAVTLRRDAAGAASAGNGLRLTSANSVRTAAADTTACTRSLDAHADVLSAVSREAERLAAEADGWAIQAVALQEGWPK